MKLLTPSKHEYNKSAEVCHLKQLMVLAESIKNIFKLKFNSIFVRAFPEQEGVLNERISALVYALFEFFNEKYHLAASSASNIERIAKENISFGNKTVLYQICAILLRSCYDAEGLEIVILKSEMQLELPKTLRSIGFSCYFQTFSGLSTK